MTSKHSPLAVLQAQAAKIAASLKAAERGGDGQPLPPKLAAARAGDSLTFGVVMEDKILTLEMSWDLIAKTTEEALAEYILRLMREAPYAQH